jgi:hypothetical protein
MGLCISIGLMTGAFSAESVSDVVIIIIVGPNAGKKHLSEFWVRYDRTLLFISNSALLNAR